MEQNNSVAVIKTAGNLTQIERIVIDAVTASPIIAKVSSYDLDRALYSIILKAFISSGIGLKGETDEEQKSRIKIMAKEVAADLRKRHATLTIREFELAVENGIRKEYGDFHGLNVATFHMFAREFKKSAEREEALRKLRLLKEEQENEVKPSDEEINRIMNEACLNAFYRYKKTKCLVDFGGAKYQHLEKNGLINHSIDLKKEIFRKARELALLDASTTIMKPGENTAKTIAHEVIKNPDKHEIVKNIAREMALKRFFDDLIETGTELKDMMA